MMPEETIIKMLEIAAILVDGEQEESPTHERSQAFKKYYKAIVEAYKGE